MEPKRIRIPIQTSGNDNEVRRESQNFGSADTKMSDPTIVDNLERWDSGEKEKRDSRKGNELCEGEKETKQEIVRELFKRNDNALSSVGQAQKPEEETQEVTSPIKSKSTTKESKVSDISQVGLRKEKKAQGRGKLKKVSREKSMAQNLNILAQSPLVGTKRGERPEEFENENERP